MTLRFPRSFRLLHSPEFARAMREGRRLHTENLVLFVAPGGADHPRLGVAVGRKVGTAVVRNRWKRLLRETFRLTLKDLSEPVDLVVVVKAASERRSARGQGGRAGGGCRVGQPDEGGDRGGTASGRQPRRAPGFARVRAEVLESIRRAGLLG